MKRIVLEVTRHAEEQAMSRGVPLKHLQLAYQFASPTEPKGHKWEVDFAALQVAKERGHDIRFLFGLVMVVRDGVCITVWWRDLDPYRGSVRRTVRRFHHRPAGQ